MCESCAILYYRAACDVQQTFPICLPGAHNYHRRAERCRTCNFASSGANGCHNQVLRAVLQWAERHFVLGAICPVRVGLHCVRLGHTLTNRMLRAVFLLDNCGTCAACATKQMDIHWLVAGHGCSSKVAVFPFEEANHSRRLARCSFGVPESILHGRDECRRWHE